MIKTNEKSGFADKGIQTLFIVFFTIVLRDVYTGNLNPHWAILMGGAIVFLTFLNFMVNSDTNWS